MSEPLGFLLVAVLFGVYGVLIGRWAKYSLAKMATRYPSARKSYRYRRFTFKMIQVASMTISGACIIAALMKLFLRNTA